MNRNTTLIFLAAFVCFMNNGNAQKASVFTLGIGRARFAAWNTTYKKELLDVGGNSKNKTTEMHDIQGMNLALGYEQQVFGRLSLSLNLIGMQAKKTGKETFDRSTRNYEKNKIFPHDRKAWAGNGNIQVLFDIVKDKDVDLTFGIGPATGISKYSYVSAVTFVAKTNGNIELLEISNTTTKNSDIGISFSATYGLVLKKSIYLQLKAQYSGFNVYSTASLGVGIGFKRFGFKRMP